VFGFKTGGHAEASRMVMARRRRSSSAMKLQDF
jgi:hypothetical protein